MSDEYDNQIVTRSRDNIVKVCSGIDMPYTDPRTGILYPHAWVQIRQINYIPYNSCYVVADVYTDKKLIDMRITPAVRNIMKPVDINNPDWYKYFDPSVMYQMGHDIQSQSIKWMI